MREVLLNLAVRCHFLHQLSGGRRSFFALALAGIIEPEVVQFDDPNSSHNVALQPEVPTPLADPRKIRGHPYILVIDDLGFLVHLSKLAAIKR